MSRTTKVSGTLLRSMRKESGYTQVQLASRIGISRETISAIENERSEAINCISADLISSWHIICRQGVTSETRHEFFSHIMNFFGFTENNLISMAKKIDKKETKE
jgi:HTH-type transcriptional regulator/antitoxin HipB